MRRSVLNGTVRPWPESPIPKPLGQTANPINEALVNTTTEPIDVVYIITPKINGCDGTLYNVTVTVNPTAVITSPDTDTVCDNTPLGYNITSSTAIAD